MTALALLAVLGAGAGLGWLWLAWRGARRRRPVAACAHGLGGCCTLATAAALAAAGLNLLTYQRLVYEQPVAEIGFETIAPETWRATLAIAGEARPRALTLRGDEWQLDARVLKWHGVANLVGLDAMYRLERLGGRYADVEREREAPRTVHALADPGGIDLWAVARRHSRWLPLVDAVYGSAAYLPIADGARFAVRLTQSGLVARAVNVAGENAVAGWR